MSPRTKYFTYKYGWFDGVAGVDPNQDFIKSTDPEINTIYMEGWTAGRTATNKALKEAATKFEYKAKFLRIGGSQ